MAHELHRTVARAAAQVGVADKRFMRVHGKRILETLFVGDRGGSLLFSATWDHKTDRRLAIDVVKLAARPWPLGGHS